MNNIEVPESLGGLGDMLPADVLKMVNELLEQLHRKEKDHQGSTVINIYGKGSLHVDHVDNQYLYGDKWVKALQNKVVADDQPSAAEPVFDKDTPLSALFRDNFRGELRKVIESWRPYLIDDDANVDAMKMHSFHFDFSKVIATSIYIDLGRLLLFSVYNCIAVCGHPLVCQFFSSYLWAVNFYCLWTKRNLRRNGRRLLPPTMGQGSTSACWPLGMTVTDDGWSVAAPRAYRPRSTHERFFSIIRHPSNINISEL